MSSPESEKAHILARMPVPGRLVDENSATWRELLPRSDGSRITSDELRLLQAGGQLVRNRIHTLINARIASIGH